MKYTVRSIAGPTDGTTGYFVLDEKTDMPPADMINRYMYSNERDALAAAIKFTQARLPVAKAPRHSHATNAAFFAGLAIGIASMVLLVNILRFLL